MRRGLSKGCTIFFFLFMSCEIYEGKTPLPEKVIPASGWIGRSVEIEITGEDFMTGLQEDFSSSPDITVVPRVFLRNIELISVRFVSSSMLRAVVPEGIAEGVYTLKVINPNGKEGYLEDAYYASPFRPPEIENVIPAEVSNGGESVVTINGIGFYEDTKAFLDGLPLKVDFVSKSKIEVIFPRGLTPGIYTLYLENPDGQKSSGVSITVMKGADFSAEFSIPDTVVEGEEFAVGITVTNTGEVSITSFSLSVTSSFNCYALSLPLSVDIPPHSSVFLDIRLRCDTPGNVDVMFLLRGVDNLGGWNVERDYSYRVQVLEPARITILSVFSSYDYLSQGQTGVDVIMEVENSGESPLSLTSASLIFLRGDQNVTSDYVATLTSSLPVDIAGGDRVTLYFTVDVSNDATKGLVVVDGEVYGYDKRTGDELSDIGAESVHLWTIESPAELTCAIMVSPSVVSVGAPLGVTMTVYNNGDASALNVSPSSLITSGDGEVEFVEGPSPSMDDVVGGGSIQFQWTYSASSTGTVWFSGSASGVDANGGWVVSCSNVESELVQIVGAEAHLTITSIYALPTINEPGDVFGLWMEVRNDGSVDVNDIYPVVITNGTGGHSFIELSPSSMSLQRGEMGTFSLYFIAETPGWLEFEGVVYGEAGTSGTIYSQSATSNAVIIQSPLCFLNPVTASAGEDKEITCGNSVQLDGSASGGEPYPDGGTYVYAWEPEEYLTDPSVPTPLASPPLDTTFSLYVFDSKWCMDTDSTNVYVTDAPQATFSVSPEPSCTGDVVNFFGSGCLGCSYLWDFGDGITEYGSNVVSHTYSADGVYDVRYVVMDSNGCYDESTTLHYVGDVNEPVGEFILQPASASLPADGSSTTQVSSQIIRDCNNTPLSGEVFTVMAEKGRILTTDVDPLIPGIQILTDLQGRLNFTYQSDITGVIPANIYAMSVSGVSVGKGSVNLRGSSSYPTILRLYPSGFRPLGTEIERIGLQFDKDMDSTTIDNSTFIVYDITNGVGVPGSVSYIDSTRTAVFIPYFPMSVTAEYEVFISGSVTDAYGNCIDGDYDGNSDCTEDFRWRFGLVNDQTPPSINCYDPYISPFSPDGDGIEDYTYFDVDYTDDTEVLYILVEIKSMEGEIVRSIVHPIENNFGTESIKWDGRDRLGRIVQNGIYIFKTLAVDESWNPSLPCSTMVEVINPIDTAWFR